MCIEIISENFNHAIDMGTIADQLRKADVKPIFKKGFRKDKKNYQHVSTLLTLSKVLNDVFAINYIYILKTGSQNISAVSGKAIAHNSV